MSCILVIGTGNPHKVEELAPVLLATGLPLDLRPASAFGSFHPDENGATLEANAIIKAQAALELSGEWALADDTGLFVDALDGRPGIYAARYAGPGCSFADNVRKLLRELDGVPEPRRGAQFSCVIALCRPGQPPLTFRGDCPGRIVTQPSGGGGFGYDPVFAPAGYEKTFAEIPAAEKNRISHRALATFACRAELTKLLASRKGAKTQRTEERK